MDAAAVLDLLKDCEIARYDTGQVVIEQGTRTGRFFFLIEGAVEVLKDNTPVAVASQPGAVFGEMAALLDCNHTTTVKTEKPSSFYVVPNPRELLERSPRLCVHICELLARRLDSLNHYLVDVKHQFEGHDHIGMVDQVLEALLHRHPRSRQRPKDSTIRSGEFTD